MSESTVLNVLSAGAAQGLVKALQARFLAETGTAVNARFGAVGAIKELLLAGEPCDVFITTQAMVDALMRDGLLADGVCEPLGRVRTGIAVCSGQPRPDTATAEGLKAALLAADAIYFPDPVRATAGIHFAAVMRQLGVHDTLLPRFRTFPNGATAMRAMADDPGPGRIGCTQITEIKYTPGVDLVGPLPPAFELATVYAASILAKTAQPERAAAFLALMAGAESRALRAAGGFED